MVSNTPTKWCVAASLLLLVWLVFTFQGLSTAIDIWWNNEIFNHCFFIIPGAGYLIYLKRHELKAGDIKPTLLPLLLIIPACLVYVMGIAGDIKLFLHLSTFSLLSLLIWLLVGHKIAWQLLFPLCFVLFSIPVGEQLTPYLQEIAADGSVFLLNATGIPLYRNGLYIEIPSGRFLVAEACSGVSFFIASTVIGCIYAYLNFVSKARKVMFVAISVILPVVANIIRIYGIILIAHASDMEYAVGADHLVYGWFFFAFVILCLLGLGELIRQPVPAHTATGENHPASVSLIQSSRLGVIGLTAFILVGFTGWSMWVNSAKHLTFDPAQRVFQVIPAALQCNRPDSWEPELNRPSEIKSTGLLLNNANCTATFVQAWFDGDNNELVSGLNRLFSPDRWSKFTGFNLPVDNLQNDVISGIGITSPTENKRYIAFWYSINGKVFATHVEAKLYQTYLHMTGQPAAGRLNIVAAEQKSDLQQALVLINK